MAQAARRRMELSQKPLNLGEQAYEHLRELILSREIPGGTELPEGRLAEKLKVSRTPMREALVRLVGEGLLERTRDRAYTVRSVSTREFFECMQVRELLEPFAVARATPLVKAQELERLRRDLLRLPQAADSDMAHWQFDNRFHAFFPETLGQSTLAREIAEMRVVCRLFRLSSAVYRQGEVDDEHLSIIEAVAKRDATAAGDAMLAHLRNLQDDVRRAIAAEANLGVPRQKE